MGMYLTKTILPSGLSETRGCPKSAEDCDEPMDCRGYVETDPYDPASNHFVAVLTDDRSTPCFLVTSLLQVASFHWVYSSLMNGAEVFS